MDQPAGKRWKKMEKGHLGDPLSQSRHLNPLICTCATHPMAGASGSLCSWDLLQGRHHRWGHHGECWSTHQRHGGKRREMLGQVEPIEQLPAAKRSWQWEFETVNGLMWGKIGKNFTGTRWSLRSSPKSRVFLCVSFEQSGIWGMAWHGECMVFLKVGWRILSDRNFGILGKLSQNIQNLGPVSGLLARLRRCFLIGATHAKIRSKKWSHPRQGESNSGCSCPYFFSRIVLWNQTGQPDFWIVVAF